MVDSPAVVAMETFLRELGARLTYPRERMLWVLDGFSSEFFIVFDLEHDPERPETLGTADVYVAKPGSRPADSESRVRIAAGLSRAGVMRLLFAMGVERFSEDTQKALYASTGFIRDTAMALVSEHLMKNLAGYQEQAELKSAGKSNYEKEQPPAAGLTYLERIGFTPEGPSDYEQE